MQTQRRPVRTGVHNTEESMVGRAHHALRAYVKAFSVRAQEQNGNYSFAIAADRQSANILDPAGNVVLSKSIADLAHEGSQVRFALAALRDVKESLEGVLAGKSGMDVRYRLDLIDGTAELTVGGKPLSKEQFIELVGNKYRVIGDTTSARQAVEACPTAELQTIACWSTIGRPIAAQLFSLLASAEEYSLGEAATEQRERAYRLGLIHRRVV
ncbi:MAG: hypothetical protein K2W82_16025 [Candidatus Obscuribacterales bacterium]|nr:hypothetical protein [Candidatus Obscuribacterales bacterium]